MRNLTTILAVVIGIVVLSALILLLLPTEVSPDKPELTPKTGSTDPQVPLQQAKSPIPGVTNNTGVQRTDGILTDGPVPKRLDIRSSLPPGTTVPVGKMARVDHGIPMPDGSFLPLLNGMTQAPPINRSSSLGDPGPIVAKTVDSAGFEWWIHADGSTTTSKYKEVVLQDGTRYWDPASLHTAPQPEGSTFDVGPDGKPIDPKIRQGK